MNSATRAALIEIKRKCRANLATPSAVPCTPVPAPAIAPASTPAPVAPVTLQPSASTGVKVALQQQPLVLADIRLRLAFILFAGFLLATFCYLHLLLLIIKNAEIAKIARNVWPASSTKAQFDFNGGKMLLPG